MQAVRVPERDPLIASLERGIDDGRPDFIGANIPRLEKLIADLQEASLRLARLQHRARIVRDRHEPPARERGGS